MDLEENQKASPDSTKGDETGTVPEVPTENAQIQIDCYDDPATLGSLCYVPPLMGTTQFHLFSEVVPLPDENTSPKDALITIHSILRSAAKTFPHTPSILRKRRRDNTPTSNTPVSSEPCDTPGEGELEEGEDGKFVSPPYRLRTTKRRAVLRSVEKMLDFSSDEATNNNDVSSGPCATNEAVIDVS